MSCYKLTDNKGMISGFICMPNIYNYKGHIFEFHYFIGPVPLRKDLEPRKVIKSGFWDAINKFCKLSKEQRKEFLIYS